MNIFELESKQYTGQFEKNDFVLIKNGIHESFLDYADNYLRNLISAGSNLSDFAIKEKKQQYLFDFPETSIKNNAISELYNMVFHITKMPIERLTLSERHFKVYEDVAKENPPPHKDRLASEVVLGIPLNVSDTSYLILYPYDLREENPFDSSAEWRDSLTDEELPENILINKKHEKLYMRRGDVAFFKGSSTYHERINAAGTKALFFKFNVRGLDPLNENYR